MGDMSSPTWETGEVGGRRFTWCLPRSGLCVGRGPRPLTRSKGGGDDIPEESGVS